MEIPITSELREICLEIPGKGYSEEYWAEIESDDMFQVGSFVGGFDADENEFCFSYFSPNEIEYGFQFDLNVASDISNGLKPNIIGRSSE